MRKLKLVSLNETGNVPIT